MEHIIEKISHHAGVFGLLSLLVVLGGVVTTIAFLGKPTGGGESRASNFICITPPPGCTAANPSSCPTPPSGSNAEYCFPSLMPSVSPARMSCGTITFVNGKALPLQSISSISPMPSSPRPSTPPQQDPEMCFWNAYQQCIKDNSLANTTLIVRDEQVIPAPSGPSPVPLETRVESYTYGLRVVKTTNSNKCVVTLRDSTECGGLGYSSSTGLQFNSCGKQGVLTVPPLPSQPPLPSGCYYGCNTPTCAPNQPCQQSCVRTLICPNPTPTPYNNCSICQGKYPYMCKSQEGITCSFTKLSGACQVCPVDTTPTPTPYGYVPPPTVFVTPQSSGYDACTSNQGECPGTKTCPSGKLPVRGVYCNADIQYPCCK